MIAHASQLRYARLLRLASAQSPFGAMKLQTSQSARHSRVELFPMWAAGASYEQGIRLRCGEKLYKVLQAHTSQANWTPDIATSLYAEVEKPGQGDTPDDPIPYGGNMELLEGKYYAQDGVVYRCIRSTGAPVYHPLRDLLGSYVEEAP